MTFLREDLEKLVTRPVSKELPGHFGQDNTGSAYGVDIKYGRSAAVERSRGLRATWVF